MCVGWLRSFLQQLTVLFAGVVDHEQNQREIFGQNIFLLEGKGLSYIETFHKCTSNLLNCICLKSAEALFPLSMKVHFSSDILDEKNKMKFYIRSCFNL